MGPSHFAAPPIQAPASASRRRAARGTRRGPARAHQRHRGQPEQKVADSDGRPAAPSRGDDSKYVGPHHRFGCPHGIGGGPQHLLVARIQAPNPRGRLASRPRKDFSGPRLHLPLEEVRPRRVIRKPRAAWRQQRAPRAVPRLPPLPDGCRAAPAHRPTASWRAPASLARGPVLELRRRLLHGSPPPSRSLTGCRRARCPSASSSDRHRGQPSASCRRLAQPVSSRQTSE